MPLLMTTLGGSHSHVGTAFSVMAMSEIPFMIFSAALLRRFRDTRVIFVALTVFYSACCESCRCSDADSADCGATVSGRQLWAVFAGGRVAMHAHRPPRQPHPRPCAVGLCPLWYWRYLCRFSRRVVGGPIRRPRHACHFVHRDAYSGCRLLVVVYCSSQRQASGRTARGHPVGRPAL